MSNDNKKQDKLLASVFKMPSALSGKSFSQSFTAQDKLLASVFKMPSALFSQSFTAQDRLLNPLSLLEGALSQVFKAQEKLLDPLSSLGGALSQVFKAQEKLLDSAFKNQESDENRLNDDSVSGTTTNELIIQDIASYFQEVENAQNSTTSESFSKKHPIAQFIIFVILLPIIVNWISDISLQDAKSFVDKINPTTSKQVAISQVQNQFQSQNIYDNLAFSFLRVVSSYELTVRNSMGSKSSAIGSLKLGDVVKLLEKKRDWSYIQYFDVSKNRYKEGWVFTRYLNKIINY